MRGFQRAVAVGATVAAVSAMAMASPASAGNGNGFVEDELFYGLFYDNPEQGIVVTAGTYIEDFCLMSDPGITPLRVFTRNDGTNTLKSHGQHDQAIFVYSFDGSGGELIGMTCEALFDDDPSTVPPVPVAIGSGLMKFTVTGVEGPEDIGGFDISNSINGVVSADDGSQWKVRARADFSLDEDGVPIGDPADFQSASMQRIRRGQ